MVLSMPDAAWREAEQAVSWHTLRPGSGRLDVSLRADGPTRVLRVHDADAPVSGARVDPTDASTRGGLIEAFC